MSARFAVFPHDRSERWTLVPGVASTRQIEVRNESDASVECHVRVDQPSAASASPAVLTVEPRHSRTADIIFLANWSPEQDHEVVVSLRDPQGEPLATFSHEIVAAESSDCSLALDYKEEVVLDGALVGFKLWFSITSRSATPRRLEVDFAAHPALRFPERKTVTLAPGEATAFEVPVEWNRAVRDVQGWNHPRVIEVFVPVSQGRRTAVLSWDLIERRLERYLGADDREANIAPAAPVAENRSAFLEKTPGQLKYTELLELKKLEQAVVGLGHARAPIYPPGEAKGSMQTLKRVPMAPIASIGIALIALLVAAFFYTHPPVAHPGTGPVRVSTDIGAPIAAARVKPAQAHPADLSQGPVAKPVWTTVATASRTAVAAVDASKEIPETQSASQPAPKTIALAPKHNPPQAIDREAVVALGGIDAAYTSGGKAVSVAWTPTAQASAVVELLDLRGKIIASRSLRGQRAQTTMRLPRGYRGSLYVQVIAFGYHGERVVQSASLTSGG
jgi:hypothetical protein